MHARGWFLPPRRRDTCAISSRLRVLIAAVGAPEWRSVNRLSVLNDNRNYYRLFSHKIKQQHSRISFNRKNKDVIWPDNAIRWRSIWILHASAQSGSVRAPRWGADLRQHHQEGLFLPYDDARRSVTYITCAGLTFVHSVVAREETVALLLCFFLCVCAKDRGAGTFSTDLTAGGPLLFWPNFICSNFSFFLHSSFFLFLSFLLV